MSQSQASRIITNQEGVHPDLLSLLARHQQHDFKRPIAQHTLAAFGEVISWLQDWKGPVVIDACCGVGESSAKLAKSHPNARVIGIDKSLSRLEKHGTYAQNPSQEASNYLLIQADLNDFWRLLAKFLKEQTPSWHIDKQFILYPNPYPKKSQLGKRWHASPVFKDLLSICNELELRSNWLIYLEEFLVSAKFYGWQGMISEINNHKQAFTPFERKYLASGQTCFKLFIRPSG